MKYYIDLLEKARDVDEYHIVVLADGVEVWFFIDGTIVRAMPRIEDEWYHGSTVEVTPVSALAAPEMSLGKVSDFLTLIRSCISGEPEWHSYGTFSGRAAATRKLLLGSSIILSQAKLKEKLLTHIEEDRFDQHSFCYLSDAVTVRTFMHEGRLALLPSVDHSLRYDLVKFFAPPGFDLKDAKDFFESLPDSDWYPNEDGTATKGKIAAIKNIRKAVKEAMQKFAPQPEPVVPDPNILRLEKELAAAKDFSGLSVYEWPEKLEFRICGSIVSIPGNECTVRAVYDGKKPSPIKVVLSFGSELKITIPQIELQMFPSHLAASQKPYVEKII